MNQIPELLKGLAVFGQVIARLAEDAGGSWRVVECGTCLQDAGPLRLLEVTLPDGPTVLVHLGEHDVLSNGTVTVLDQPPRNNTPPDALLAWVRGISVPALET